ncbi:MAG: alpha/beta hydrolase [Alphaproteobacteria bacterium]|nr:alpha/beta hydrolase [Alphaproteobacteria bacterium]
MNQTVRTPVLQIAYQESGRAEGIPVILLHGWPSDPHDWDGVAPGLAADGCRVLVPWLRGFGPTRFLDPTTPRSGQQAALGADVRDFMDALGIPHAVLVGYDWGGRAACIAAALWPERVRALVTINGYAIQDIAASGAPASAAQEHRLWYQWYFHTERGRIGLSQNRRDIAKLLWHLWSPNWDFDNATFEATATSFENPDFVEVTIQSYRHRYGNAPGDPALEPLERQLAALPPIAAPTIVLHGEADGVGPVEGSAGHARHFTGAYQRRVVPIAGHFLSRENPETVVQAVRDLLR